MIYSANMNNSKVLLYDGSFNGFLTAIFAAFDENITVTDIQRNTIGQPGMFSGTEFIITDLKKAKRVRMGIRAKSYATLKKIYYAFLSETKSVEIFLYFFIKKIFGSKKSVHSDYSDAIVLKISQLAKSVGREKHRMEAFVRFQLTKDGIYFANIEPDFDVLPLISGHFSSRYADQQWIIYDVKRKYGLYYDLKKVEIISLDMQVACDNSSSNSAIFSIMEFGYQELWNDYFKSTNIKSRINIKLHKQHVPERYWKYLSEKK